MKGARGENHLLWPPGHTSDAHHDTVMVTGNQSCLYLSSWFLLLLFCQLVFLISPVILTDQLGEYLAVRLG